jgi:hypothetical protein
VLPSVVATHRSGDFHLAPTAKIGETFASLSCAGEGL